MFRLIFLLAVICTQGMAFVSAPPSRSYYTIRIYHYKNAVQESRIDSFLSDALIPALHRQGISKTGVFKPIANDTIADKKIVVLIPFPSVVQMTEIPRRLEKDKNYVKSAGSFIGAAWNDPPFERMETILLYAFELSPTIGKPALTSKPEDRVYELRSYESATENLYRKKVKMFNTGGEIVIFNRLGFNPVFYGEVMAGSHMPNLMYMTSFENMQSRDAHWKSFTDDPAWKKLSPQPEYEHTVSRNDMMLMRGVAYSEL